MDEPASADDLARRLDVAKGQLQRWLQQAVADRKARKLANPVRYAQK